MADVGKPVDLLREAEYLARDMAPEIGSVYKFQLDNMLDDLFDRIKKRRAGLPFGGGEIPEAVMGDLQRSIEGLRRGVMGRSNKMGAYIAEKMSANVTASEMAFIKAQARKAPGWVMASGEFEKMGEYLKTGSLLRRKVLERIGGELRGTRGKTWMEAVKFVDKFKKGPIPIHWRMLPAAQRRIYEGLRAGMTQGQLIQHVQQSFGVDFFQKHRHPAMPHPVTGDISDPAYGLRRGFASIDNPNGVMGDVKRLIRTEGASAHNNSRMAAAKANPLIIGIRYTLSTRPCDECVSKFGGGTVLFKDNPDPDIPPDDSHPNCFCSVSGYEYMSMQEAQVMGLI